MEKFTIEDVHNGVVAVKNDGSLKQLIAVMEAAFPKAKPPRHKSYMYYFKSKYDFQFWRCDDDLPEHIQSWQSVDEFEVEDPVNSPSHYTDGKIEVIDFIEDKRFNYRLGNAIKYLCRAGKKNPDKYVEDLQKAIWYIQREIKNHGKIS